MLSAMSERATVDQSQEYRTKNSGWYLSEQFITEAPVSKGQEALREYFSTHLKEEILRQNQELELNNYPPDSLTRTPPEVLTTLKKLIDDKGNMIFDMVEFYVGHKFALLNAPNDEKRQQREQRYMGVRQTLEWQTAIGSLGNAVNSLDQLIEKSMSAPTLKVDDIIQGTAKRLRSGDAIGEAISK
jgi:hypothetical protein